jgi:replication-associated recombination protein RarA
MAAKPKVVSMPKPPEQLTDRWDPKRIDDFVGFDGIRKILKNFAAAPYRSAWLLLGPSGLGKTSLGFALAEACDAELYHVPSRDCTMDKVDSIIQRAAYVPMHKKWHLMLVDEADQMTEGAQHAFLSVLDKTRMPTHTIFVFTANSTRKLEGRFLSRCRVLQFDPLQAVDPVVKYLARIWKAEGGKAADAPDFGELFRKSDHNIRTSVTNLEMLLTDPTYVIPEVKLQPLATAGASRKDGKQVDPKRRAAALKAWETMRRNRGL